MILTRLRDYVLTWIGLLALLLVQIILGRWLDLGIVTPLIGVAMALPVALVFMHLRHGTAMSKVFAFTGALWIAVMLSMTMMDIITRTAGAARGSSSPTSSQMSGGSAQVGGSTEALPCGATGAARASGVGTGGSGAPVG